MNHATGAGTHSGDGPRHLGEQLEFPPNHPLHQTGAALTRAEYYALRDKDDVRERRFPAAAPHEQPVYVHAMPKLVNRATTGGGAGQ